MFVYDLSIQSVTTLYLILHHVLNCTWL